MVISKAEAGRGDDDGGEDDVDDVEDVEDEQ